MLVRAVRRTVLFLVALFLVACAWELYKAIGPDDGGSLLGIPLAKTSDRAMPHTWDIVQRLNEPETRSDTDPIWRTIMGYSWYSLRLAVVGLAIGTVAGVAVAVVMTRFRFVERGLLPWVVMSQTVPLIALAPQFVSWSGKIHIGGWEWPKWMSVCTLAAFLSFFPIAVGTLRGLKIGAACGARVDAELRRRMVADPVQAAVPVGDPVDGSRTEARRHGFGRRRDRVGDFGRPARGHRTRRDLVRPIEHR